LAHKANPAAAAEGPAQTREGVDAQGSGRIFIPKSASNLLESSRIPGSGFLFFLTEVRYPTW
jgi:hypothetical protein